VALDPRGALEDGVVVRVAAQAGLGPDARVEAHVRVGDELVVDLNRKGGRGAASRDTPEERRVVGDDGQNKKRVSERSRIMLWL
jgi:hypothetical protein